MFTYELDIPASTFLNFLMIIDNFYFIGINDLIVYTDIFIY